MWEQRWAWSSKPSWWDGAWRRGLEVLSAQGRHVETRPDTYLVLAGRPDAGLKLRGGRDDDFDLKVRHRVSDGWELWEKVAYFKWDALEAVRLAAMLRVPLPDLRRLQAATPAQGVEVFLTAAGLAPSRAVVDKKRVQCQAADLLQSLPGMRFEPDCVTELVELRLPERTEPFFSLCIESMSPGPAVAEGSDHAATLRCGYPELLIRSLRTR